MKKEDKIVHLIEKLNQSKPELQNPEMLTNNIMRQVGIAKESRNPKVLIWLRVISGSAAITLLGLFLFQQTEHQNREANYPLTSTISREIKINPRCEIKTMQHANLLEIYFCHIQQNTLKNHKFRSLIANSNNNYHENNN